MLGKSSNHLIELVWLLATILGVDPEFKNNFEKYN
jgi:hypothetical protein